MTYAGGDRARLETSEASALEIPSWVPAAIATLGQTGYAEAIARPLHLMAESFEEHAKALKRVASDDRMERVWSELYGRRQGVGKERKYAHPANPKMVHACPYFSAVKHISNEPEEQDRVQEQAAAVMFLVVTGHFTWDRRYGFGPRTRTEAEINREIATIMELADRHEQDACTYDQLGSGRAARTLRTLAADNRKLADLLRPDPQNPWTVKRKSSRWASDWDRGLIIQITQYCTMLFGKELSGTVATLANVALDRNDITKATVQGVVKHVR